MCEVSIEVFGYANVNFIINFLAELRIVYEQYSLWPIAIEYASCGGNVGSEIFSNFLG